MNKFKLEVNFRLKSQSSCYGFFKKRLIETKQNPFLDLSIGFRHNLRPISKRKLNRKIIVFLQSIENLMTPLIVRTTKTPLNSFVSQLSFLRFYFMQLHLKRKNRNLLRCFCKCYVVKKKFKGHLVLLLGKIGYLPKKHAFLPIVGNNVLVKLLTTLQANLVVSQRVVINSKSKDLSRFYQFYKKNELL